MKIQVFVLIVAFATVFTAGTAGTAWAQAEGEGDPQPSIVNAICPVMGNPIDPEVTTDLDGERYAFCCAGCIDKFRKDPASYPVEKTSTDGEEVQMEKNESPRNDAPDGCSDDKSDAATKQSAKGASCCSSKKKSS